MIAVGITGGIASGKTTVAGMFADAGIPVFNADAVVHAIYDAPPPELAEAFPDALVDGRMDRGRLSALLAADPAILAQLEAVTHPIVMARIKTFLGMERATGRSLVALEIPLLFETGADDLCDRILVTTVPPAMAEARMRERGMAPALYRELSARQLPGEAKIDRADYLVDTGVPLDDVRRVIGDIVAELITEAEG